MVGAGRCLDSRHKSHILNLNANGSSEWCLSNGMVTNLDLALAKLLKASINVDLSAVFLSISNPTLSYRCLWCWYFSSPFMMLPFYISTFTLIHSVIRINLKFPKEMASKTWICMQNVPITGCCMCLQFSCDLHNQCHQIIFRIEMSNINCCNVVLKYASAFVPSPHHWKRWDVNGSTLS